MVVADGDARGMCVSPGSLAGRRTRTGVGASGVGPGRESYTYTYTRNQPTSLSSQRLRILFLTPDRRDARATARTRTSDLYQTRCTRTVSGSGQGKGRAGKPDKSAWLAAFAVSLSVPTARVVLMWRVARPSRVSGVAVAHGPRQGPPGTNQCRVWWAVTDSRENYII
jgi:hypothetical protein